MAASLQAPMKLLKPLFVTFELLISSSLSYSLSHTHSLSLSRLKAINLERRSG